MKVDATRARSARRRPQPVALLLLLFVATACSATPTEDEPYVRPVGEDGPWVLVDLYHSRKQNPEDAVLDRGVFSYQGVFGFHRVFRHLENNDYNWTSIRTMGLSKARLEGFDTLFINLVSNDRPDFTAEEIEAILDFVENGGGLFVIADHTNVYRHAERVNPFLEPMGIEVLYHIAADYPPVHAIAGLGWIQVWDFSDHPAVAGLDMISLQTGGPLRTDSPQDSVAFTSDQAFADFWDPEDTTGYYGNWRHDGDEELEPLGPLTVVAAAEFGEGRVAVVGDQNIFGDAWTHWGDNFELAANIFEWTSKQEDTGDPLRGRRPFGTNIAYEQLHTDFDSGKQAGAAFFSLYTNANRDLNVSARGTVRLDNVDDALIILSPKSAFTPEDIKNVKTYLDDGKPVVVSIEPGSTTEAAQQLLFELAPDLTVQASGASFTTENLADYAAPLKSGKAKLRSDRFTATDLEIAAYTKDDFSDPGLTVARSDWGEPFLTAEFDDGTKTDIARAARVLDGELIVFFQDGFWRNRSIGGYLQAPVDEIADNHTLHFRFQDYLKTVGR